MKLILVERIFSRLHSSLTSSKIIIFQFVCIYVVFLIFCSKFQCSSWPTGSLHCRIMNLNATTWWWATIYSKHWTNNEKKTKLEKNEKNEKKLNAMRAWDRGWNQQLECMRCVHVCECWVVYSLEYTQISIGRTMNVECNHCTIHNQISFKFFASVVHDGGSQFVDLNDTRC